MRVLVTGAAGYIGSHAVKRLLEDGHFVVGIDSFIEGKPGAIAALRRVKGGGERFVFERCDIADRPRVEGILRTLGIEAIVHFAAFANLRESVSQPLRYYHNNTAAALSLVEAADAANIRTFVFSSTCATYGDLTEKDVPVTEDYPHRAPINPYGHSKLAQEWILEDWADARRRADKPVALSILRYFNVAGCDRSGLLGEDRTPHIRIIPILIEAALGRRESVTINGTDWPTPDGTCIRDYIHVDDLVDAHAAVLTALRPGDRRIYNLGLGHGTSVRELIASTQRVTGAKLTIINGPRAAGDPAMLYCDPSKIERELGWKARVRDLDEIVRTAADWMRTHPNGYEH